MIYASEKRRRERKERAERSAAFADDLKRRPEQLAKAWAWRLKRREEGGEKLSEVQKAAWRQALGEK